MYDQQASWKKAVEQVQWDRNGLVNVVIQDKGGSVLTLGTMNATALEKTLQTGLVHMWSRSKGRIRMKGEVSGNTQKVEQIWVDCDGDALLLQVEKNGPACHTGNDSCFFQPLGEERFPGKSLPIDYSLSVLKELEAVIAQRKQDMPEGSYTTSLFEEGREKIFKKFGEEAVEVLVASNRERLVYEISDMLYHLLVLMAHEGVSLSDVMASLSKRRK